MLLNNNDNQTQPNQATDRHAADKKRRRQESSASSLATTSLVLGILGYMGLGFLTGIPSIVCGHKAKRFIDNTDGEMEGRGTAIAGLIFGYSTSILSILLIITLSCMLVSAYIGTKKPERINRQAMARLESALNLYEIDVGNYPSTAEGLGVLTIQPTNAIKWDGPYVHQPLTDPWNNTYRYKLISTYKYSITSAGPDGAFGTRDDITN